LGRRSHVARKKQRKGWRREKKLNLTRTTYPEFKDLAQALSSGRKSGYAPVGMTNSLQPKD
jgi:hypothetical protein